MLDTGLNQPKMWMEYSERNWIVLDVLGIINCCHPSSSPSHQSTYLPSWKMMAVIKTTIYWSCAICHTLRKASTDILSWQQVCAIDPYLRCENQGSQQQSNVPKSQSWWSWNSSARLSDFRVCVLFFIHWCKTKFLSYHVKSAMVCTIFQGSIPWLDHASQSIDASSLTQAEEEVTELCIYF